MTTNPRVATKIEDGWNLEDALKALNRDCVHYFDDLLVRLVFHKNPKKLKLPTGYTLTMQTQHLGVVTGIGGENNDEKIEVEVCFR